MCIDCDFLYEQMYDVLFQMISAEAPVLFSKACEIFVSELSLRAWIHTEDNKRRTLQVGYYQFICFNSLNYSYSLIVAIFIIFYPIRIFC